jgi:hypothetical protein
MESVIVRLSTMVGWEWEVPPNKEQELLKFLNTLGTERTTEAMGKHAAEMQEEHERRWEPFDHLEKHAHQLKRLAVMAETHDVRLTMKTIKALFWVVGHEGLRRLEGVLARLSAGATENFALDENEPPR